MGRMSPSGHERDRPTMADQPKNIGDCAEISGMVMAVKVVARFMGGPHDGAEREIDFGDDPFPLVMTVIFNGVLADYHYRGFEIANGQGVAFYSDRASGSLTYSVNTSATAA